VPEIARAITNTGREELNQKKLKTDVVKGGVSIAEFKGHREGYRKGPRERGGRTRSPTGHKVTQSSKKQQGTVKESGRRIILKPRQEERLPSSPMRGKRRNEWSRTPDHRRKKGSRYEREKYWDQGTERGVREEGKSKVG